MNCPKCKNPISDNSQECEWCGVRINKPNTQKNDFNIDEEKIKSYDSNLGTNIQTKQENKSDVIWGIILLPALCLLTYIICEIVNYFR